MAGLVVLRLFDGCAGMSSMMDFVKTRRRICYAGLDDEWKRFDVMAKVREKNGE